MFDPNAASELDTLFGLPILERPLVEILPVGFDATTSYRGGTASAPPRVLEASQQVDVFHPAVAEPWLHGIQLAEPFPWMEELSASTHLAVESCRAGGDRYDEVNAAGERVAAAVDAWTQSRLDAGQIPAVLGGDHSVPLGAFRAATRKYPELGILHVDAHADLRVAYEGFTHSHASIFHNALELDVGCLAQVGIRDFCHEEAERQRVDPRIHVLSDEVLGMAEAKGEPVAHAYARLLDTLPRDVWISFDIDGLDPALCPNTGTPVPGGLSWRNTLVLLRLLGSSGRRIVGFDLCEVGPSEWDANVGARLLFQLACWSIHTRMVNE